MVWLMLLAGLVLLLGGGESLVRGAVALAGRMGVSPLLIGLTLVGFGTSMPELVASLQAALAGSPGVAVGNVVGSNICNILLILGISAIIRPMTTTPAQFRRDVAVAAGAAVLMTVAVLIGILGRVEGAVFIVLLLAYTVWTYRQERIAPGAVEAPEIPDLTLPVALGLVAAGIAGVVIGASLLVTAAIDIARGAGVSETIIGLTLVSVGTSLPELVTSVMAALRRQGDVALGNIIGSNIFNVLGIAGVTSMVVPLEVPAQIVTFDIWVMLAATAALALFGTTRNRISRGEGVALLGGYAAYLGALFSIAV